MLVVTVNIEETVINLTQVIFVQTYYLTIALKRIKLKKKTLKGIKQIKVFETKP